jgi:beta-lactamase regulating signal transducer with metallopeptidase domain
MIELGMLVLALAVQTTVLSLCTYALLYCVRGRDRGGLAVLTTFVLLLPLLAAWTFWPAPLPEWRPALPETGAAPVASQAATEPAAHAGPPQAFSTTAFTSLLHALPRLESLPEAAPVTRPVFAGLAVIYLAIVIVALCRLLAGYAALAVLRRRCQPMTDPQLLALLDECRGRLRVPSRLRLYEGPEPGLIAVVGWWRPAILLPPEWRAWTPDECRAALAHELAHAAARHYLVGLIARCAAALHGYHPLVWLLLRRLRWEQEVAADARAADMLGRLPYLRALARIALDRPTFRSLPAPAMDGGAITRRIAMLKDDTLRRPLSGLAHGLLCGALVISAALVLTVRGPLAAAPGDISEESPYDFRYVCGANGDSDDEAGIVAFRPAEILAEPGIERLRAWGALVAALFSGKKNSELPAALRLENFDQVVMRLLAVQGESKYHNFPCIPTMVVIRLKNDVDWVALINDLGGKVTEHQVGTQQCFRLVHPIFPDLSPTLFSIPDRRTLVWWLPQGDGQDEGFARSLARAKDRITQPKRESLLAAPFVVLVRPSNELQESAKKVSEASEMAKALPAVNFLGVGIGLGKQPIIRLHAETDSAEAAGLVERAIRTDMDGARAWLDNALKALGFPQPPVAAAEGVPVATDNPVFLEWNQLPQGVIWMAALGFGRNLLGAGTTEINGTTVRWSARSAMPARPLFELLGATVFNYQDAQRKDDPGNARTPPIGQK